MKKLYYDISKWIKKPDDIPMDINWRKKSTILGQIFILDIIIGVIFIGLTYLIDNYIIKINQDLIDINPSILLLFAVVVLPTLEEILFRFPLKYKRNYLIRGLDRLFGGRIKDKWNKNFKYFVYIMTITFGLIHLTNFGNDEILFFCLGPIIVGSQLIGGLILSYTRIKLGFIWSIIQHGLFNLFAIVIGVLFFHNSTVINDSKDEYYLHVSELMYVNKELSSYSTNIKSGTIYSIRGDDINLQKVINSLNIKGVNLHHDTWVDVHFESENGISNSELLKLLKTKFKFDREKAHNKR
jgi:membrane protease YdiL (CAAX protease family)